MARWAGGWRRTAVVAGTVLCGTVLVTAPARADVSVTPRQAVRGEAANLTIRVTDERGAAYTTKVELLLPEATPIAEVWPLSVPDWAPKVVSRKLDRPITGVHHGQVTEVTSQITWFRATSAKPSDVAELQVSLGPMPETDRLVLGVVQTYSDGTVVRWDAPPAADGSPVRNQAAVVTLTAPTAAQGGGANGNAHGGAHGASGGAADQQADGADQQAGANDDEGDGRGLGSLATGLLIGLLVGGGVAIWLVRGRRAPAPEGADGLPSAVASGDVANGERATSGEPVAARRAWRLRE